MSGTGGVWQVRTSEGVVREASLRGRLKQEGGARLKLAVGDAVVLDPPEHEGSGWAVAEILPRRSKLARRAPDGKQAERIIVANLDQVVVVMACVDPEPVLRTLDRFLVIAAANELPAHIVLNKIDLAEPAAVMHRFRDYAAAGYPLHLVSSERRIGLEAFHALLAGRSSALTGPSGVGKSSLMNALYPGLALRVGEVSAVTGKGKHTTVGAVLHPLPDGGFVADTPGLREVDVWGLEAGMLERCFPEFAPFLGNCRFADCAHSSEPECALRDAIARGQLSAERFDSYGSLRAQIESTPVQW